MTCASKSLRVGNSEGRGIGVVQVNAEVIGCSVSNTSAGHPFLKSCRDRVNEDNFVTEVGIGAWVGLSTGGAPDRNRSEQLDGRAP
jgi:hypothetical protein